MTSRKHRRGGDPAGQNFRSNGLEVDNELFARPNQVDTKAMQLCHQVEEAISYALVCSASPILRDLYVVDVEPLRGVALLQIYVSMEGKIEEPQKVLETLSQAKGYFRAEVARSIHRKRVPTLAFVIIPQSVRTGPSEVPDE